MRQSGEDYLETIFVLNNKLDGVHAVDIANHLNYSKPSVTRAMNILKSKGLIFVDADNHIFLTEQGLQIAQNVYERHNILTEFLISLGVCSQTADQDACKMEHILSQESYEKIKEIVLKNK